MDILKQRLSNCDDFSFRYGSIQPYGHRLSIMLSKNYGSRSFGDRFAYVQATGDKK